MRVPEQVMLVRVRLIQVVATLVSEIVLCTKEVNQKTRAAAYALLVGLGAAMHEAAPPPLPDLDARMGGLDLQPGVCSVLPFTQASACQHQTRGQVRFQSSPFFTPQKSAPCQLCCAF